MITMDDDLIAHDSIEGVPHPASIASVVGQMALIEQFATSVAKNSLHHAWLLKGPPGIGKASTAFLLSKLLLSEKWRGELDRPLAQFVAPDVAGQVSRLAHPNLLYLSRPWDADKKRFLSVISAAQVRRINRFFGTKAASGKWRICIVDAVDDLNQSSANAILKNLEEPPENTLLFLVFHARVPVLATIRSRCRVELAVPLSADDCSTVISRFNSLDMEPGADIAAAVALSQGSVRFALQLILSGGTNVSDKLSGLANGTAQMDPPARYQFVDQFLGVKNEQKFRILLQLADHTLHQLARRMAMAPTLPQAVLALMDEVWETTQQQIRQTDIYNLDRRHLVLNLLRDIERLGKAVRAAG
jgi:DNA polymerase-3 subunit delta'